MQTPFVGECNEPSLLSEAEFLVKLLRMKSVEELSRLMRLSPKLSELNHQRFQCWQKTINTGARPALFCFKGDVYRGLSAHEFSQEQVCFAQKHLRILSGLYGVLRPLDAIYAYRLEMGTKLPYPDGKNLYDYWREKIAKVIKESLLSAGDCLVNLASQEYFKAVDLGGINSQVISPIFQEKRNHQYKVIGLFAKKARGMMASYAIKNAITDSQKLKFFCDEGYAFSESASTNNQWVFRRS